LSALKNKFYSLSKYRTKKSQADEIENKNDSNQQMNKSNQQPNQDQADQPTKRIKLETKVTSFPSVQQSESICELSSDDLFQCQETLDPIESTESIQPAHSGQPARSNCSIADNGPLHGVKRIIAEAKLSLQRHQQQVEDQITNTVVPSSSMYTRTPSLSQMLPSNHRMSTQLEYMNPNRNETNQLNESCSSSCFLVRPRSVPATRAAKFKWTTEEVNETENKYNNIKQIYAKSIYIQVNLSDHPIYMSTLYGLYIFSIFFLFFQEFVLYEAYAYFEVQSVDGRVHWSKISKHPIFGHKLKRHYPARLVKTTYQRITTYIKLNDM
jgi:hypothetical protein